MSSFFSALLLAYALLTGAPAPEYVAPQLTMDCASAPEFVLADGGSCGPVQLPAEMAAQISECGDDYAVFVDPVTGEIYGDQDMNGRLDGDDCNWS